ncbi:MAG: YeeE/YedE family protein [Tenericutes bacterium]|nr:YeeE/YedE family protein [Mycoplasmatota bacterium]
MKALSKKQLIEAVVGFALIALVLVLGFTGVLAGMVFVKTLIGLGLGYALTRGDYGFAGLSNRTCRKGSTKLIRSLMLMFVVSSIIVGALLVSGKIAVTNLWINPISWGLLIGGILFGIGMAFSSCCATGVLQDFPLGFSRALITIVFFGIGVFLGFPLMSTGFAQNSLFASASDPNGVWFVDWFSNGGTNLVNGVVGAILLTVLLAVGVGALAKWYEKKISKNFTPEVVAVEVEEVSVWNKFFVKKWSMTQTALVIAILFGAIYAVSSAGLGASTVYGNWFGTILVKFGADPANLAAWTGRPESSFTTALFASSGYMQNVGIIVGAFVGLLLSGRFTDAFKSGLKIKPLEILLFVAGGLLLGFGTRLSLGCNVGALYTPIANFSLAGWFYFFFLFFGGWIGNKIRKAFYVKVDTTKIA